MQTRGHFLRRPAAPKSDISDFGIFQTPSSGKPELVGGGVQLGSSTVSITWMTPFDWNTFWIVTLEALPLASQMVSA
jgi:hypothetical protein